MVASRINATIIVKLVRLKPQYGFNNGLYGIGGTVILVKWDLSSKNI
jgi:hypothetical protein